VVRRHLKQRYFKWFADVLRKLEEKDKAVVMLGDQLIGELSVDEEGYLHWKLLIATDTLERLARLEHERWMQWSKSVAQEVSTERRTRWEKFWAPYEELSESVKEKVHEWAYRILEILEAEVFDVA